MGGVSAAGASIFWQPCVICDLGLTGGPAACSNRTMAVTKVPTGLRGTMPAHILNRRDCWAVAICSSSATVYEFDLNSTLHGVEKCFPS
jgi:hypothetical protein